MNANKTELLFASSSFSCAMLSGSYPALQLGANIVAACSHICLLDVDISRDLSLDHHVSLNLHGLLLLTASTQTSPAVFGLQLIGYTLYAVVNSPIDYCNTVLAGAPRTVTDKLLRALNAAARVITGTWKFEHGLGQILHDELHWLDVPDRVFF